MSQTTTQIPTQIPLPRTIPPTLIDGHAYCYPNAVKKTHHIPSIIGKDTFFSDYIKTLIKHNIGGALLTQPSVMGLNHHYLLECLDYAHTNYPDMFFRGVVNLPPNVHISTMKDMNMHGILGVRMNLIDRFAPDFHSQTWKDFVDHLHKMNWFLQIQIESNRLQDILPTLLAEVPYLIVEHFCLPDTQLAGRDDGIMNLSKLSHSQKQKMSVLFSGPYRIFDNSLGEEAAYNAIPIAHTIIDAMGGEEFCIWGSDWPFGTQYHHQDYKHTIEWGSLWLKEDGRKGMHHLLHQLVYR